LWQDKNGLNPFADYTFMVTGQKEGKELFYKYNFDYVIINTDYPLNKILTDTEKWPVIFADEKVIIFKNKLL
jgi:hypothetical protein